MRDRSSERVPKYVPMMRAAEEFALARVPRDVLRPSDKKALHLARRRPSDEVKKDFLDYLNQQPEINELI